MSQPRVEQSTDLRSITVRLLASLFLCAAFVAAVLPLTHAEQQTDTRPRRATTKTQQTTTTTTTAPPSNSNARPQATPIPTTQQRQQSAAPPSTTVAAPAPSPTPAGQEIDQDAVITVDTSTVPLNVRVIDRNNRPVNNVRREDFHIYEDGVPQTITYFSRQEVPISYGLVVDNSGSLRGQLNQVIDAGKTIINSNKPGDETFLVRFVSSDKIETLQDFTADQNKLMDAIDDMYIEGGQTAIIDAVMLAAERVSNYKKGNDLNDRRRRALIVVTDGEDRASYYKQEDLFRQLREEDVQIYVIGFVNELESSSGFIRKSSKERAVNLLNRLATETGGRAFFPNSTAELPTIAQQITQDLRTQYVIYYDPTNKARDGAFHSIRVQIADADKHDKRIAITRTGRTAPRGPDAQQQQQQQSSPNPPVRRP